MSNWVDICQLLNTHPKCATDDGHRVSVDQLLHVTKIYCHICICSGFPHLSQGVLKHISFDMSWNKQVFSMKWTLQGGIASWNLARSRHESWSICRPQVQSQPSICTLWAMFLLATFCIQNDCHFPVCAFSKAACAVEQITMLGSCILENIRMVVSQNNDNRYSKWHHVCHLETMIWGINLKSWGIIPFDSVDNH